MSDSLFVPISRRSTKARFAPVFAQDARLRNLTTALNNWVYVKQSANISVATIHFTMRRPQTNFAFIDSQNLYLSVREAGWHLDFARFRVYLSEKYGVAQAFLFIGYQPERHAMYTALQRMGYVCIFKPTLTYKDGTTKGNCDAELVLHTMIEFQNYERAVIVTGDGDFHCLVDYLIKKDKLEKLLIPNQTKYSALLKRFPSGYLAFISDLKNTLKRKEPREDGTSKGAFRGDLSSG